MSLVRPVTLPFRLPRHRGRVFEDDFGGYKSGSAPFGWTEFADVAATWTVSNGVLSGVKTTSTVSVLSPDGFSYKDGMTEARLDSGSAVNHGPAVRVADRDNFYLFSAQTSTTFVLFKRVSGVFTTLATVNESPTWPVTVAIECIGSQIRAYVRGRRVASVTDSALTVSGRTGLFVGSTVGAAVKADWLRAVQL